MNKNLVSTFPERLKECLDKETSISATTLAEEIGMSKQAISMYISGNRNPKRPTIKAIAEILKVDEAWLMGYDVPMRPDSSPKTNNKEKEETFSEDIRRIARAHKQMSEKDRQRLMTIVTTSFEEYFSDDFEDDDKDE